MNKRKISIITLGCKVNQYESNSMAKYFVDHGLDVTFDIEPADAYIVNTCAVTNEAERKSRGMISKIRKIAKLEPIYICGCSSQNDFTKFSSFFNVNCIYGTSSKIELAQRVIDDLDYEKSAPLNVNTSISEIYQDSYMAQGERTRAVIKIQDGCNNFCSYCIIPYIRGRERSRTLKSVENEIEFQAKTSNEIVFTGINLSNYGKDLGDGTSLKDIAILMRKYPNVRFRFSSLEQDIITEDFLLTLKDTANFAPHFHLSLQSGCDRTLKYMNRKYTAEVYYKKIELIRKFFDNPAITTDIIVGFPTETQEDAMETYKFVKKCKFAKMHIFPYSKRSGTVASRMKNLATNVKERCKALSELDKQMQTDYIMSCQDKIYTVIIETKQGEYYEGHTENYIKCYISSEEPLTSNQIVKVKILKCYKDGANAQIVSY